MYKYFINLCILFFIIDGFSQNEKEENQEVQKDSISYKSAYGLRIGIDISKPIKAQFSDAYKGLEIVGDYRVSKNWYVATELGYEEETTQEDYTNSIAKGNYIRLGFNYNTYKNWLDMNNEIFLGYRYGLSFFEQTLNNYTPNVNSQYFPANNIQTSLTTTNLNAHWSEFVIGFRAETIKNVFITFSGSYKILMSVKDPENFKTLFSPGFNRIFESDTGFGFNYTLTYLIPFSKK